MLRHSIETVVENTLVACLGVVAAADGKVVGGLIAVIGILLLVGIIIYCVRRSEKKRTEQFQQVAQDLGLPFFPKGDDSLLERLDHFHLFSQGHSRKIKNMLHGETDDVELAIFGYRYIVGGGKHTHMYNQSVIYFRSPTLNLPQFAVRPEGLFHKVGGAFGYQDIDFETHPQFSRTYLLRGDDELAVRELFSEELLTFFESQQKISVEGGGDQLVFYRGGKRMKPDEVQQFMQEGYRVFALFRGVAEGRSPAATA